MRVVILKSAEEVSRRAAELFATLLKRRPGAVLGLATGSTPLATYQRLIELYRTGQISFAQATSFNLDEYVAWHLTIRNRTIILCMPISSAT